MGWLFAKRTMSFDYCRGRERQEVETRRSFTALASALEPTEKQDRPFYFGTYCLFVSAIACKSGRTELSLYVN
jgi:hypothetical protein